MKKLIVAMLITALTFSNISFAYADKYQNELNKQKETINNLEYKKQQLNYEINSLDNDLVNTMVEIELLEKDLQQKQKEIESAEQELLQAEQDKQEQYEYMKKRIQSIYENGGTNGWVNIIFESDGFADLLNRTKYTQELYNFDRKKLDEFEKLINKISDLKETLESEKSELEIMQKEKQNQEEYLKNCIEEKKRLSNDYDKQISIAKEKAEEYKRLIEIQNEEIRKLEEQKKKEQNAQKKKENVKNETPKKEEVKNDNNTNNTSSNSNNSNVNDKHEESNKKPSSNTKGYEIVNYATQFVGNPYVWGGTSLTNGADCSGFIMSVYAHFGYSLPHSSSAMRSCGVGVPYSEAQAGDIICYSGHVAIYMGNGAIVHASNEKDGIKISPNASYRQILAVRRII